MDTLQKLIESEIGDFFAGFGSPGEPETPEDMQSQLLARITPLFSSMEQEPVFFIEVEGDDWIQAGRIPGSTFDFNNLPDGINKLYAAPQLPQPVPDALERLRSIVADPKALPRRKEWVSGQQYSYVLLENVEAMVDDACRAAMLQGAEPVQGWIPCSERMPEFDTGVLLYFPDYGGHIESGCIGDEGDGAYHYFFDGDSLRHEPTHWMPLPAAPQQEAKP